ncbi:MAG: endonuclease domain-containing protein [Saprospiraceae bacterium]|nr:endonuclease domain-containing protein [Candidatus Opimibacter iunctus]
MKTNMHLRAPARIFGYAKWMRNNPTKAEELLWSRLRGNQTGYKFRRQHPMSGYVVDFYCHAVKYVIELDGSIHDHTMAQLEDENKDIDLADKGIFVQRFTDEEVLGDIDAVMKRIHETLSMLRKKYLSMDAE